VEIVKGGRTGGRGAGVAVGGRGGGKGRTSRGEDKRKWNGWGEYWGGEGSRGLRLYQHTAIFVSRIRHVTGLWSRPVIR
jgi:hypothetical protein